MIYIIIGTKAQFIKMAPVMLSLKQKMIPFKLYDLAQHKDITPSILKTFNLKEISKQTIISSKSNISSYRQAISWSLSFLKLILKKRKLKQLMPEENSYVLVHGDTLSTLFGSLLCVRAGKKLALVEAGLTSKRIFSPFPEEIIRRIVQKMSDILYAPGDREYKHLNNKLTDKLIINTNYNTGNDATQLFRSKNPISSKRYQVVTLHRLETIKSRKKLEQAVIYIINMSQYFEETVFCLHEPTLNALKKYKLLHSLESTPTLSLKSLLPYNEFIHLLCGARQVLTDGGSIQEECANLSLPCIILRDCTERQDGIDNTAILTSWQPAQDKQSIDNLNPSKSQVDSSESASDIIVNHLSNLI